MASSFMEGMHSAGDVGRFTYCAANWDLARRGVTGSGGKAGAVIHADLAKDVDALELYQRHARVTLETGMYSALAATSAAALGVELNYLEQATEVWWVLVVLSVALLAASLYLMVFHRYYSDRAQTLVRSRRIAQGDVKYADSSKHPEEFVSDLLPVSGRPDYVVERNGAWIPVELKTGTTPPWPYDSHVMQLAAYCHLVENKHGVRPPYGIVSYPKREFQVPYTAELENRLVNTLLRMEAFSRLDTFVKRDHENPRRCAGCSRREACSQRLDVPTVS